MDTRRLIVLLIFIFSGYLLLQNWQDFQNQKNNLNLQNSQISPNQSNQQNLQNSQNSKNLPEISQRIAEKQLLSDTLEADDSVKNNANLVENNWQIKTNLYEATISAKGGSLVEMRLSKYHNDENDPEKPLLYFDPKHFYSAQNGLISDGSIENLPTHNTIFKLANQNQNQNIFDISQNKNIPLEIVLIPENNPNIRKIISFSNDDYVIKTRWEIINENLAKNKIQAYYQLQRDNVKPDSDILMSSTFTGPAVYTDEEKYQKIDFEDIANGKAKYAKSANNGWIAMVQHYFVSAWIPPTNQNLERDFYAKKINENLYRIGFIVPFSQDTNFLEMPLYVGPQEQSRLEKINEHLPLVVDYGWLTLIAKPLFWLLQFFYDLVGNWGWAIILMTLAIKLVFFPLSAASYRSMAKMRIIMPRMQQIKERYANDRQKLSQEMMKLYQSEKINPLGGCLPILIQIPVFLALYWVLLGAVEMYGAPWLGWIKNLIAPDPYFVLPILFLLSMVIQMRLNPTPADPVQAKVMMVLPFVFSVMFIFFPAGLVLYWVVNNFLSIAQQWYITKHISDIGDETTVSKKLQKNKAAND